MSRLAVFAYASLVDPASASQTLGRPVEIAGLGRLPGWSRGWTVARDNRATEKTFARPDGSLPRFCLALDLAPELDAPPPNGALIEVSEAELGRLDLRELRYERVEVTEAIAAEGVDDFAAVFAYRSRPEHHALTPPEDAVIIAAYRATVEAAFAALGADQLELFRATTPPPPVEPVEATLVNDRIPEGNPRAW